MPTAAALVGGSIVSSAFGARESRRAGETAARGQRRAGRLEREAFREQAGLEREAGQLEAGAFRQFADVERETAGIRAGGFREAAGRFEPFAVGGAEAAQQEAALSGALGPEAQQRAIDAQVESPFTRFIEQRGRQQIGQGFAAGGGLGGGERLRALTEFGQGVATQSLSQQLQNLRSIRQQGFGATGNIAELIARATGAEAGGVSGAGSALLGAAGAEAGGIRGAGRAIVGGGAAEARGISGAATSLANARLSSAGQIQQGISGIATTGALQLQGLFDRPAV